MDAELSKETGTRTLSAIIPIIHQPCHQRYTYIHTHTHTRPASQITFKYGLVLWNDWEDH